MTDHWEYYPCQVEDQTAFIFYDHGISETIDDLGIDTFLWLKVPLQTDNGSGLPLESEFEQLAVIDDLIEEFVEGYDGAYVGRVTAGKARFFHCYLNVSEDLVQAFVTQVNEQTGYQTEYLIEEDKNKDHYWADLYPSDEDLHVMRDLKVMEELEENGDDSSKARRIDHWVYFKTEENLNIFQEWAKEEGFSVESFGKAEEALHDHAFVLQFYITERPVIEEVSETTAKIVRKAEELDGEYDGWETSVEPADPVN